MERVYNIPTIHESLYNDYKAGEMTLRECAKEFHLNGWTTFVNLDYTRRKFAEIEKKNN